MRDHSPKSRSLHYKHLPELVEWLDANEIKHRESNNYYAVMDVYHDGHWMGIYSRKSSEQHMRIDRRLYPVIKQFFEQRKT